MYICESVYYAHMPKEARGVGFPGCGVRGRCELPDMDKYWEQNSGSLKDQYIFFLLFFEKGSFYIDQILNHRDQTVSDFLFLKFIYFMYIGVFGLHICLCEGIGFRGTGVT